MSLILSGTDGISDVDGTAATPAIRGTDTNTGIFFPAADTIAFSEGGTEVARFDSSGNFGVGVTPNGRYQLQAGSGTSAAGRGFNLMTVSGGYSGGDYPSIGYNFRSTTTSGSYLYNETDIAAQINFSSVGINFNTAASGTSGNAITYTERMRIDSSGNLLVGTTSVDAAGSKIQLSSSQNRVFTVQNTANLNGDQALWVKLGSNCNTTASPHLICETGGTNRLIIWGNGNVVNTNNSYGAISDIKLKENIVDATPKLDKLNQVRVVNYNLIGEEQKQIGVIAQDLEQIFPSMIDESPDFDKDGNDLGTKTKQVKYSVFVPMLIKAMQELKATVDAQAARIAALESAGA
jgi:hypothetical protein